MSYLSRFISVVVTPFRILATWFSKLIPGFRKLGQLSLAARITWMMSLFLLIVLIAGIIKYWLIPENIKTDRNWLQWGLITVGLMIPIMFAVYWFVRLLKEKPVAVLPELDRAWKLGIDALEEQRIPVRKVPLFVILGTENAQQVREVMEAVQFSAAVAPPKGEDLPLLWYANSQAIFLFVPGTGCLSAVSRGRHQPLAVGPPQPAMAPAHADAGRTLGGETQVSQPSAAPAAAAARQTLGATQPAPAAAPAYASAPASPASAAALGTLSSDSAVPGGQPVPGAPVPAAGPVVQRIGEDELDRQARRLNYVCSLLRTARRPVCPINGLMVVTPFPLIESGSPHPQIALQNDLRVLRERLAVRCPAALLVSEMEHVDGFLELVKRFGVDDARERRLGKGCEAWGEATVGRVDAVAAHAIGSFEDLIYLLFQSPETLRRRYNGKLVALLCRSRGIFAESLRSFTRNAFGYDAQANPELAHSQFLFTGCYFAATGGDEDHRAFSKAVFNKLVEQQGELEWTPKARREDQLLQTWANLFALVGMLALAAVIVGIILLFWNPAAPVN